MNKQTAHSIGQICLRRAQIADLPVLNVLIPRSVRSLSAGFYTPEQIEGAIVDIFGVDTQLVRDGTYFVAEIDGVIRGCGGWSKRHTLFGGDQRVENRLDRLLDPASEAARIRAFFIDPHWARRGIGREILGRCTSEALHAGFHELELGSTLPGEPFYLALGFVEKERSDVRLTNGATAQVITMCKKIGDDV